MGGIFVQSEKKKKKKISLSLHRVHAANMAVEHFLTNIDMDKTMELNAIANEQAKGTHKTVSRSDHR